MRGDAFRERVAFARKVDRARALRHDPLKIQPPPPESAREAMRPVIRGSHDTQGESRKKCEDREDRHAQGAGHRRVQTSSEYRVS